eukprot:COSAG01_NODE_808_length_13418_cov_9.469631_8_plen_92_part_00
METPAQVEFARNHEARWRRSAALYRPCNAMTIASYLPPDPSTTTALLSGGGGSGGDDAELLSEMLEAGREGRAVLRAELHRLMDAHGARGV